VLGVTIASAQRPRNEFLPRLGLPRRFHFARRGADKPVSVCVLKQPRPLARRVVRLQRVLAISLAPALFRSVSRRGFAPTLLSQCPLRSESDPSTAVPPSVAMCQERKSLDFSNSLSLTSSASKQHICLFLERPKRHEWSRRVRKSATFLPTAENQNKQLCITGAVHPARLGLIVADMPHTSAKIAPVET
jgi:hypothetical protein